MHGVASARAIGVSLRWYPRTVGGQCYELVDGPGPDTCGDFVNIPPNAATTDSGYTWAIQFATPPSGDVCVVAWFDHSTCGCIEPARFYVADLMLEDEGGERDYVPVMNEATILGGAGIDQPLALQASGRYWLIPGFVNAFHVAGVGFDSTTSVSLRGEGASIEADVALDSPRSLSVSFDVPESVVGQVLLVAGNASGALDTLATAITLYDSTAATGSGVNGTDAPMDKPAPDGAWRKFPGDSTWAFVPAVPESVFALGFDRLEAYVRAHSASRTSPPPRPSARSAGDAGRTAPGERPSPGTSGARMDGGYDRAILYSTSFEDASAFWSWTMPGVLSIPKWGRVSSSSNCAKTFAGDWSVSPAGDSNGGPSYCFGYHGVGAADGLTELRQESATVVSGYKSADLSFWRWIDTEDGVPPSTHTDLLTWYYSRDDGVNWISADAYGLAGHDRTWRKEAISLDTQAGTADYVRFKFLFAPTGGSSFFPMPNDSGVFVDDVSVTGVPYPNLTYWRPSQPGNEWSGPIVVAAHPNAIVDEPVTMGQPAYFRFALRNNSYSGTASTFRVILNVEGLGDVYDQRLGPFAPWQEWMSPSIAHSVPGGFCGERRVTLTIDPEWEIYEQNEDPLDNSFRHYVTWGQSSKPDLRVVHASSDPPAPCADDPVTLRVVVGNLGTAAAGAAVVRYAAHGTPGGPCPNGSYMGTTGYLLPGETDTLSVTVSSPVAATHSYDFGVDCTGSVDEGCPENEVNSFGPVTVTWAAPGADLAVTSFGTTNPNGIIGHTTQINVTVANVGQVATPNVWSFDWYQNLSGPPPLGQRGIMTTIRGVLAPGGDTTVTLNKTSPIGTTWRMYVRANADTSVGECRRYANNVAGPAILTWLPDSVLVRGRFTYRDTGYVRDGAPIGSESFPVHPLRGARVAILDRQESGPDRLLGTTCTDDDGNFALALASRYDPEVGTFDDPHLIDVYARALLNVDEICAGIPAVTVKHWSDTTTWVFDGPVRADVAGTLVDFGDISTPLGPSSYGIRSAMHIYETILGAAQRMRGYGFEPVTYPVTGRWNAFVRWEPGGESYANYNLSLALADTLFFVGARYLTNNPFTPDEWDDYVLLHEYGHLLARKGGFSYVYPPGYPVDSTCGRHGLAQPIMCPPGTPSHGLGWEEGWCMFVAALLDSGGPDPVVWDRGYGVDDSLWIRKHDLEDGNGFLGAISNSTPLTYPSVNDSGPAFQEANAGALWDWIDPVDDDQNGDGCDDHLAEEFGRVVATLIADPAFPADSLVKLYMAYQHRHLAGDLPRARALFEVLCEHGFWNAGADQDTTGYVGVGPSSGGPPRFSASPSPTAGPVTFRIVATLPANANAPSVQIFDVAGRAIWRAAARPLAPGLWEASWLGPAEAGEGIRPGVYFARCAVGGAELHKTLVVRR